MKPKTAKQIAYERINARGQGGHPADINFAATVRRSDGMVDFVPYGKQRPEELMFAPSEKIRQPDAASRDPKCAVPNQELWEREQVKSDIAAQKAQHDRFGRPIVMKEAGRKKLSEFED